MVNCIKISNLDNNSTWEKQLTNQEFSQVKSYIEGKRVVAILPATFKPVRTNNLNNFSKDFFLPTTLNHAINVQNTVAKIFAILASLVLDILTFPIRLVTCIPRIISNAKQKQNPLQKYLREERVDEKLLVSGYVRVRLEWEGTSEYSTSTDDHGVTHYDTEKNWSEQNVNFIEVPTYEDPDYSAFGNS